MRRPKHSSLDVAQWNDLDKGSFSKVVSVKSLI